MFYFENQYQETDQHSGWQSGGKGDRRRNKRRGFVKRFSSGFVKRFCRGFCLEKEMTISLASWFLFVQLKPHPPMTNSAAQSSKTTSCSPPMAALLCITDWHENLAKNPDSSSDKLNENSCAGLICFYFVLHAF